MCRVHTLVVGMRNTHQITRKRDIGTFLMLTGGEKAKTKHPRVSIYMANQCCLFIVFSMNMNISLTLHK